MCCLVVCSCYALLQRDRMNEQDSNECLALVASQHMVYVNVIVFLIAFLTLVVFKRRWIDYVTHDVGISGQLLASCKCRCTCWVLLWWAIVKENLHNIMQAMLATQATSDPALPVTQQNQSPTRRKYQHRKKQNQHQLITARKIEQHHLKINCGCASKLFQSRVFRVATLLHLPPRSYGPRAILLKEAPEKRDCIKKRDPDRNSKHHHTKN